MKSQKSKKVRESAKRCNYYFKKHGKSIYRIFLIGFVCFFLYLKRDSFFGQNPTTVDLALLAYVLAIALLPLVEEISVLGVSLKKKIDRLDNLSYRGEVVRTPCGDLYYIDTDNTHHALPKDDDRHTANFLHSQKGILDISFETLSSYKPGDHLESVRRCRILMTKKGHLFAIINGSKYYVNSWSYLMDWGRTDPEEGVDDSELAQYPRGK